MSDSALDISNIKDICVFIYTFGEYTNYINNTIQSLDKNIFNKIYVLNYDGSVSLTNTYNDERVEIIDLSQYGFNIPAYVNKILEQQSHNVYLLWNPTFIYNIDKNNDIMNIYERIKNNVDVIFIYGITLWGDIWHINRNSMYTCRNGGCMFISNRVRLDETRTCYSVDKTNLNIIYRLYDKNNTDYFFYDIEKAVDINLFLLSMFNSSYMNYVRTNTYLSFSNWYKSSKNQSVTNALQYVNCKLLMNEKNDIVKHNFNLSSYVTNVDEYTLHLATKERIVKLKPNMYHNYKMTIVTTVRNNKRFLKESMGSLLTQTSKDWNCIIVNDGSIEDVTLSDFLSDDVLQLYSDKFTIINKEWGGLIKAHKTALLHATNDIVGILDADDVLDPIIIEKVLELYNKNIDDNIFVYTNFNYCDENMNVTNKGYCKEVSTCILNDRCVNHFRTFKLKHYYMTKGYDDDLLFGGEDQDIMIKLEQICRPIYLDMSLYNYRVNKNSLTSLKILPKYFLFLSIFKHIMERNNNLDFTLKIFSNDNKNLYNLHRVSSNKYSKCFALDIKESKIIPQDTTMINVNNAIDLPIYCAEIYSNNIFVINVINQLFDFDGSFNIIKKLITEYNVTGKNTFNVNLKWNTKENKFFIDDKINSICVETFRKIHPNLYFNKIYIINLKKDVKKRERMRDILDDMEMNYTFFDAVYGKDEQHIKEYQEQNLNDTLKSPGAYGYTLTMINIFKDAVENNYKKILVCDDDIIFHNDFLNMFDNNIRSIPYDWMVLFFGLSGPWTHPFVNNDVANFTYDKCYIQNLFNCDGSYCVGYDRLIMEKLIEIASKFEAPFDTSVIRYLMSDEKILKYAFYPYLAIADTTTSDITMRESDIMNNYLANQFRFRQNMRHYRLTSMINKDYDKMIQNPYPLVSIIMPLYNKERYVDDAIQSILKQTYRNIELIIVNDCSTDKSADIISKYKDHHSVKIIHNTINMGCYYSRNIGIKSSFGEFVGIHDADDYMLSTKVEKLVKLMINKNLLMTSCNMIRSHMQSINYNNDNDILKDLSISIGGDYVHKHDCCIEYFGYPTMLFRRALFDKYGMYIERRKGMDMEFPERVLFKELGILFKENESSWNYLNKEKNSIYEKINELLVISPELNEGNITVGVKSDDYLINKAWRKEYLKIS